MDFDFSALAFTVSVWALPVLIAVTLHEAAHGFAAHRLGDPTAYMLGRVTLNPVKHVDPFGTVVLPGIMLLLSGGKMMFGYAKPVPVNFGRLRHFKRDMVLVAAAGPAANIVIAVLSALGFYLLAFLPEDAALWVAHNLANSIRINVILCLFNLLPLPPLDGGRIAVGLLPAPLDRKLASIERYGMLILIGMIFLVPYVGGQFGLNLNIFYWLVGMPAENIVNFILQATGVAQ